MTSIGLVGTPLTGGMEGLSVPFGKRCSGEKDQETIPLVQDLATHVKFPKNILRVLCWYFEHQRRVQFIT